MLDSNTLPSNEASSEGARAKPIVWAILCYRQGDNAQILAVAEATGWQVEVKRLAYRRFGYAIDVWRGTTLLGLDRRRSDRLGPPWPDLIISASMRNEPVCRWIRKQSGGRARYIHMGRTWAPIETFDLVITAPEFRLRRLPNVHHNALSLHRVTSRTLNQAVATWLPRLEHLPHPRIAVLVGGYGGPYAFEAEKAERLGREASALAASVGGSLLITTSARTRKSAADALERSIAVPAHLFRWAPSVDNPFYAYLGIADAFIVTCDSASMLAEACATRKPVYMFDLGPGASASIAGQPAAKKGLRERARALLRRCDVDRVKAFVYRQMLKIPPRRMTRDIRLIHRFLLDSGRAVWLGQPFPTVMPPPLDEMPPTIERVRALVTDRPEDASSLQSGAPPSCLRRSASREHPADRRR